MRDHKLLIRFKLAVKTAPRKVPPYYCQLAPAAQS